MYIKVEHPLNDPVMALSKQVWEFAVFADHGTKEVRIKLDRYMCLERKTKRHDFKVIYETTKDNRLRPLFYNRLSQRDSGLTIEEVELPDFIAEKAKQQVIESLTVVK